MLGLSHHGHVAPLHSEAVLEVEYADGRGVGAAGVQLKDEVK